jgi:Nucleoside-diphosphate-sugar epimerases
MNDRMLITGASGFLGYHLINAAREKGLEVDAGIRRTSDTSHLAQMGVSLVEVPYDKPLELDQLMATRGYRCVVHAAAVTRAKDPAIFRRVNVEYAEALARAAVPVVEKFVFISSLAAIGPIAYDESAFIHEDTEAHPITAYGQSKMQAEGRLKGIAGLPLTIVRPTAVYGPRERDLFVLFRTIAGGVDAYIGKRPQRLSFVHAEDLAALIIAAATQPTEGRDNTRCYNVSDGKVYGRYEMADTLKALYGRNALRVHLPVSLVKTAASIMAYAYRWSTATPVLYPERIGELTAQNWACDIGKAVLELGYSPKYDLRSGLEQTIAWYKANQWI